MSLTDHAHVVGTEDINGRTHAVLECPDCDEPLYIMEEYFSTKKGTKGTAKCRGCGEYIEYEIPQDETELSYIRME